MLPNLRRKGRKSDVEYQKSVVYDKINGDIVLVKEIRKHVPENTEWLDTYDGIIHGKLRRYDGREKNFEWIGFI